MRFYCKSNQTSLNLSLYCKFENFRENFIFGNCVKRHIWDVNNSELGHDLPISVNDSDFHS